MKLIDIKGQRFHKLLVLEYSETRRNAAHWKCLCDCGNIVVVSGHKMRSGHTKSCSCDQKLKTSKSFKTHGLSTTPEFRSWQAMKARCYNPKNIGYKDYGAKGITVCDQWINSFETFISDMGMKPTKGHTIDRIDYTGNYEPSNCKWSTKLEQGQNTSRVIILEYKGVKKIISVWVRELGVSSYLIKKAIKDNKVTELFDQYACRS